MMSVIESISEFMNSNLGLITLLVGGFVIYLYLKGRKDNKRDAALLILQEIRYAEQRVRNYRSYGSYAFTEKLLPTNSWHTNINLFMKDLKETDIDMVSKFYSSAAHLDDVISTAARFRNEQVIQPKTPITGGVIQMTIASADLEPPAKDLIEKISESIEYIYNTPTIDKLRLISKKKWYELY